MALTTNSLNPFTPKENSMFTSMIINYVLARAKEGSTWVGLMLAIQNGLHIQLNGDLVNGLVNLGLTLAGIAAVIYKEGVVKK